MGHDVIGGKSDVITAGGGQVHHGHDNLGTAALLEIGDFTVEQIAGGHRSAGGVDFQDRCPDTAVSFSLAQLGDDVLNQAGIGGDQALFGIVGNHAGYRDDQDFFSGAALQGILFERDRILAQKRVRCGHASHGHERQQQDAS